MGCCETKPSSECSASSSSCDTGKECCPIVAKLQCMGSCVGPLALRLALAVFMIPHGYGKITNWSGTIDAFQKYMGIPAPLTAMAILTEFFGPILLVLGLATRAASFALLILITVAAVKGGHIDNGFLGTTITHDGKEIHLNNGYALHVLYGGAALALLLIGPGKIALDSVICRLIGKKKGCCAK